MRLNHCVLIHAWLYSAMNRITTTLVLLLVRMSKEPGWLEGFLNGKQGLVPANYVVYIEWRHWSGASALHLSSRKSHQTVWCSAAGLWQKGIVTIQDGLDTLWPYDALSASTLRQCPATLVGRRRVRWMPTVRREHFSSWCYDAFLLQSYLFVCVRCMRFTWAIVIDNVIRKTVVCSVDII